MKKITYIIEIISSLALVSISIFLFNPGNIWMPDTMVIFLCSLLVAFLAILVLAIIKFRPMDEREITHENIAGRLAFISGIIILAIGIFIQAINHKIDPWLIGAICMMVLIRLGVIVFKKTTN